MPNTQLHLDLLALLLGDRPSPAYLEYLRNNDGIVSYTIARHTGRVTVQPTFTDVCVVWDPTTEGWSWELPDGGKASGV